MVSDWIDTTIGEQLHLQRGIDITRTSQRLGSIPVVSSGGISSFHDTPAAKGPGVVLGRKGVVGSVYYVEGDYWPHDTTLWVTDFKGNCPRFVYYFFKQRSQELARLDVGSANPTLNRNHVHPIRVRWPSVPTQLAIAHLLGALDDKIGLNHHTSETLEAMARALFKSWFVDFDPVRAKAEGRRPPDMGGELAKLFPSELVDSALGPIPRGWTWRTIGDCVTLLRGTTYSGALVGMPGPALLGLGSIQPGGGFRHLAFKTYGGECPAELMLYPGDLYVSLKGATKDGEMIGSVARVPATVPSGRLTQDTVKLEFRDASLVRYMYRLLLTPEYRAYCANRATGSAVVALSRSDFLAYSFAQPPAPLLEKFNAVLREMESRAEHCVAETTTLSQTRDNLLPKLLSGEIAAGPAEPSLSFERAMEAARTKPARRASRS